MVELKGNQQDNTMMYILIGLAILCCSCCLISSSLAGGGVFVVGRTGSGTEACTEPPATRSCSAYNIGDLEGVKYVCPKNYTLINGYPPGGLKGPQCHMNNGSRGTPATCSNRDEPGCDYKKSEVPCLGLWPVDRFPGKGYYGKYYVVPAMPAAEVCNPSAT